jgi:hypothetical protein
VQNFIKSLQILWIFIDVLLFISFAFLLTLLNVFHYAVLLSSNRTTIEFCDPSEESCPYDQGTFKNFKIVLGKNPLIWLLPLKVQIDSSNYVLFD